MSYAPHSSHHRRRRTHLQQQAHHLPRSLRPPIPHPWRLRPQHSPARSASPNREITAQAIRACIKKKCSLSARPTAPAPACALATRAEVNLSGPASCSCSSRARSSGAALPPLELRRAWHARGRWPPAEVGRAGARWQGMQAGGGAGRQAGRRLGAEERRAHLPLPTAAALPRGGWLWHGSRCRHSAAAEADAAAAAEGAKGGGTTQCYRHRHSPLPPPPAAALRRRRRSSTPVLLLHPAHHYLTMPHCKFKPRSAPSLCSAPFLHSTPCRDARRSSRSRRAAPVSPPLLSTSAPPLTPLPPRRKRCRRYSDSAVLCLTQLRICRPL